MMLGKRIFAFPVPAAPVMDLELRAGIFLPGRHKGWEMVKKKQPELLNSGVWSDGFRLLPVDGTACGNSCVVETAALGLVDVDVSKTAIPDCPVSNFRNAFRNHD